jgi:hypothetical protein
VDLPEPIAEACAPLFTATPMDRAMSRLTGADPRHSALVEQILQHPAIAGRADLAAGLWLYVGDLDRSHAISQSIPDATGSYWHGIMHRREGDFGNSHYWMRRAADHPLIANEPHLDPHPLIDAVSNAVGDEADLVERQRQEWTALFVWCANRRESID